MNTSSNTQSNSTQTSGLEVIIMAAGKGTRMRSDCPKVLHCLAGKPLLAHILQTTLQLNPTKIHVVIGHKADQVQTSIENMIPSDLINWVVQKEQLGTGHAVMQTMPYIDHRSTVLILNGDTPLITAQTLSKLLQSNSDLTILTTVLDNPFGMGRIIRNSQNQILGIIEEKDASPEQREIRETYTGFLSASATHINQWLTALSNDNAQQEYYLTELIAIAQSNTASVSGQIADNPTETQGINSRVELARLERVYQLERAKQIMESGVTLLDPHRFDIRGESKIGQDCLIDLNVILEGQITIGCHTHIGPNCLIRNSTIGDNCVIEANSVIDGASIGKHCNIGPFARIRPDSHLLDSARIGNFVEIKKSEIGQGSKVNHLSYVGDSQVGQSVNIGAGVITCNYDGANKHKTTIGDHVFVGSDCQLVAPVVIHDGATVGAGTTVTRDVQAGTLAISRNKQQAISNWKRPTKQK